MRDHHRSFLDRLIWRVFIRGVSRDLDYDLGVRARGQSAEYAERNMASAMMFYGGAPLVEFAARQAESGGLFLDFGVDDGEATNILAVAAPGVVHGFDTFQGLPEDWGGTPHRRGAFSRNGKAPRLLSNVRLHTDPLIQALPAFLESHPDQVSFVRLNTRTHAATETVLDRMADRLSSGSILVFANYFNYPHWMRHEHRALREFAESRSRPYRYIGFDLYGRAVAIQLD